MNTAPEHHVSITEVTSQYPCRITPYLEKLIRRDTTGALAQQFTPSLLELTCNDGFEDPIGDLVKSPIPGLIHRYADRVLLLMSSHCFAYCRFCFRKSRLSEPSSFVHQDSFSEIIQYISNHRDIWEVILSGGDPLTLSNNVLQQTVSAIAEVDHVETLRIHSRAPVVNPERIDHEFLSILKTCRKTIYFVLHANHPNELTTESLQACSRLTDAGVVMLSQSVLLRGINDSVETLSSLMRLFVKNRIKPYYLHNCDLAKGTSHFRVDLERGRKLVAELRRNISGLCQPTFILDIPHGFGKVPAGREYVSRKGKRWESVDPEGKQHFLDANY